MNPHALAERTSRAFRTPPIPHNHHCCRRRAADGALDVAVRPERAEWATLVADLSIPSPGLCRGLFELYLGSSSGARAAAVSPMLAGRICPAPPRLALDAWTALG